MFTAEEATKERVGAYVAALESEKAGYNARLKALADGKHERLTKEQLDARVKGVDAEIARVTNARVKKSKAAKAEDDE